MKWTWYYALVVIGFCSTCIYAEPNGAVLYRNGARLAHCNVPSTAEHHYFGFLEGPAWENKYCAYRVYVDSADRNALDFVVKFQPAAILQYFSDPTVDEHNKYSWGTDCFSIGSTMGLGPFRLFYNNQWINPRIGKGGKNLDSLVISILDSSTQTPKVTIAYYGWNLGGGKKVTVLWTMTTTYNERPTHCEVNILGDYTGKVAVGIVNNNKRGHTVTVIKDSSRVLLATIGRQGGLSEGFTDTMVLAAFTSKKYFSSFADNGDNYGMLLTPDENHSVKWSIAYSMALETAPFYRGKNWQDSLFPATGTLSIPHGAPVSTAKLTPPTGLQEMFTISGRKINPVRTHADLSALKPYAIIIAREKDGSLKKRMGAAVR